MTRKQNFWCVLGAVGLLVASQAAQAQSDLKIGFVNIQALLENAPQIVTINRQLQDEFAQRDTDFQALNTEYTEKAETYQRDATVMGEAERTALERELTQMQRDLERQAAQLQEDLQIRQNELLSQLQLEILQQIRGYAEAEGFDLIVTDAIFVSAAVDITAQAYEAIGGQLQTSDAEASAE